MCRTQVEIRQIFWLSFLSIYLFPMHWRDDILLMLIVALAYKGNYEWAHTWGFTCCAFVDACLEFGLFVSICRFKGGFSPSSVHVTGKGKNCYTLGADPFIIEERCFFNSRWIRAHLQHVLLRGPAAGVVGHVSDGAVGLHGQRPHRHRHRHPRQHRRVQDVRVLREKTGRWTAG